MLGKIAGAEVALSLLLKGPATAQAKSDKVADDTKAKGAQDEQASRAQQALDAMKQANANQKQQRKSAAKAKIEQLKKELEALKLMGGDPKAVARRAAQIARELSAAAKEYAAGSGNAGLGLSADEASGATPDKAAAAEGAAGDQGAAEQADAEGAAADAAAAGAQASAEGLAAKARETDGKADAKSDGKPGKEPAGTEEDKRRDTADRFQKIAAELRQNGDTRIEDTKFAAEVRRLFAQVKSLLQQQRRRAAEMGVDDDEMDRLAKSVKADAEATEHTFTDASLGAMPVPLVIEV
ncbi:MAG TPA: hypothetical protein VK196_12225 [Magnetospirillum sp.]|nr:hypothetical protein [Magnetospirillum sp.]